MVVEKSCGAVVFTRINGCIAYVIIESLEGIYGFPKGHSQGDETEKETALREIREETGLSVRIIDGFKTGDSHTFKVGNEVRMKQIVYYLAEYSGQIPTRQASELRSVSLMDFETALTVFQYKSSARILREANSFLRNYCR